MPNKFSNPILGGIDINTQPYYAALAKKKVAQDGLKNTISANPFDVEGIDADRANLSSTLDPYNQQVQDLINTPGALEDSRSLTSQIMDLNRDFRKATKSGDLAPYIQRKKDYDSTISNFDEAAKAAKTTADRQHVFAQKQAFIDKQTAYSGGDDASLSYLEGLSGERADILDRVDPIKYTDDLGKRVKEDGIDLGVTTKPVPGNPYYELVIQGQKVFVDKAKLGSSIIPGIMAKRDEFARMAQVGGRANLGIDTQGNLEGEGGNYAIDTATGKINPNTELGAAITSAINAYSFSKEKKHGQLTKSAAAMQAEARAKATPTKVEEDNRLRLFETQENVKVDDKGNANWAEARKGVRSINKKLERGEVLTASERARKSNYERSKQIKGFHDEQYNQAHPERLRAKEELNNAIKSKYNHLDAELLDMYISAPKDTGEEVIAANTLLGENILRSALDGKGLDGATIDNIVGNLDYETTNIHGAKLQKSVFGIATKDTDALAANNYRNFINNASKSLSPEEIQALREVQSEVLYEFSTIADREVGGLGEDIATKMEASQVYEKMYNKSLDQQLQRDLITQGFAITPEARGKGVWDNISKTIIGSHYSGTKVRENLGSRVYKVSGGDSEYMDVDEDLLEQFSTAKNVSINKIIDYDSRAPQMEMRVEDKDGNSTSYIVDVPSKLQGEFEQFYTESAKTPQSKRIGLAGSVGRVEDQRRDFKWKNIKTDFTKDNNVINDIKATGSVIRPGVFGDGANPKEVNVYQEHLDNRTVGIKVKAGLEEGKETSLVNLQGMADYYKKAFSNSNKSDSQKIAPLFNMIYHHLQNNMLDGPLTEDQTIPEAVKELEAIARNPKEGDFERFLEMTTKLSGLTKTPGFSFPNKNTAMQFLTVTPEKLGPVKGQPGK